MDGNGNRIMDKEGPTTIRHRHIMIAVPSMTKELHQFWLQKIGNGNKVS